MTDLDALESLYLAALAKAPSERAAFLDEACAGNTELRACVERLLAAQLHVGGFLEPPASATATLAPPGPGTTAAHHPCGEAAGTVVAGKYKLLQPIGEGGMGTVWMADQSEPVKRRVAVKLIRAERGSSKAILARFEAERQAIALMDHPHIARLLDAGTTDAGKPFFVMELVKGVPLNEYCDTHKLTVPDRLALFHQICGAVQHAHQKGIIHRDLKPSNILVESHDGKPVPKVIDFGLAKATTGLSLTEHTLFTAFGSVMGTPLYMAPEQAAFNAVDVDTRADVFALGVILYELLTGTTPLTRDALKKAALDEMLKLIREQETPKPSSRLSASDSAPSVAADRQTEPQKLGRFVRGELDWICLKALAKDRDRRYETVSGLAKDIERFLQHEPVTAGPPTAAYRLRKFVRRNRPQVVAASLVLLALVAGTVGTSLGLVWANRAAEAERVAAGREAERAEGERQAKEQTEMRRLEAEANLAYARKGNEILGSVFDGLDPTANYATVGELREALRKNLARAVKELEGSAIGDPLTVADMQNTLGLSLLGLGEAKQAVVLFERARATRTARLGADHQSTLVSMNNLAEGYRVAGNLDQALPLYEEALKLHKAKPEADQHHTLTIMNNLAEGYRAVGKMDRALPLYDEALKLAKTRLGIDHSDTLTIMNNLALGYRASGKLDLALPLFEETLKLRKAKLGADHPDTLVSMSNLAAGYRAAGRLDLALPLYEETLNVRKAKLGADHQSTLVSMNNLAAGYRAIGKMDLALPLFEETLKLMKAKLGVDHPDTLVSMNNLAEGYRAADRLNRALPLYLEAAAGIEKRRFRHEYAGRIVSGLIACLEQLKQFDEAETWWRKWLSVVRERAGADSAVYADGLTALGLNQLRQRKWTEAESTLRECLAIREKQQPDAWVTFYTRSMLGEALLGQKRYADAEPLLLKGYEGMKAREKTILPHGAVRIHEAIDRLIELSTTTNKPDEAKRWRAERAKYPPEQAPKPRSVK